MKNGGFTLIELIITMVILAIISVVAIPKMFDTDAFEARGFHDEAVASIRYAQKVAIAQRSNVFVNVNSGSGTLCLTYVADPDCNDANAVRDPSGSTQFTRTAPGGITINSSVQFYFTPLGQPIPDGAVNVNVVGAGVTRTITVERETGYVH
ncbi:prepilin-type N-terminal cleavage/methylation domain-containing protein [Oxalobacteraceae bacterium R-40]|uniref:Type II secretion system protein H n=1 Tax=Keguizhuia sedimenti TaxID=3064264 RepID=A0ABU1BMM4_9BURK|nr:prepilin-type N-terminal cleavage/methylation domain-containing protein [Oxalobacteraceae bacterium R-40]